MAMFLDSVVSGLLQGAVSFAKSYLEESGYGHWAVESWELEHNPEASEMFSCHTFVKNFLFTGASDLVVHDLKFDSESSKVYFDISIPKLMLSLGKAGGKIEIVGNAFKGELKGKINIIEPRITGKLSIEMSDDFSFSLGKIDAKFLLGSIKSNLKVNINETSYNKLVNDFLSKSIPAFLMKHSDVLNKILEQVIKSAQQHQKKSSNNQLEDLF